jgi:hypothetical protein
MTTKELQREVDAWKKAVEHSRSTIHWLEERAETRNQKIRLLEAQVIKLGGIPYDTETLKV